METQVVVLSGDLDIFRAGEVRQVLEAAAGEKRLIIDLREVRFISAAILSEFVRTYKERLRRGLEAARLVVRSPHIRKVFEITKLAGIWPLYDSLDAAASMP
jgi:anti-anti-sigma factor